MNIFVVIALSDPDKVGAAAATLFASDHIQVAPLVWLVAGSGLTAKDVSDRLGITEGAVGTGMVVTVGGYFGRASTNIWEWIATKTKAAPHA